MLYDNRQEDPEERLHKHGPSVLSTAELLSVLFSVDRSGSRDCSVEEARVFLDGRDSVSELLHAGRELYCRQFGVVSGPKRHAILQAGIELCKRCVGECLTRGDVLSSPQEVRLYLSMHLTGLDHEVFSVLLLDKRHRVIEYRELFQRTIDSAAVYPREVVKLCLSRNASAVIFAHNHPSGISEPSDMDVRLTRILTDALALVDVRVLDHLIVGRGEQTSLAERGLM